MSAQGRSGISTAPDPLAGALEAAQHAAEGLGGRPADLALVFASGAHLAAPEATLEGVHGALAPASLVGCGAGGVLGAGRELESGTAVAVWAAALGDGGRAPFHASVIGDDDDAVVEGLPELAGDGGVIMLSDPYSFPTDAVLRGLAGAGARGAGPRRALQRADRRRSGGAVPRSDGARAGSRRRQPGRASRCCRACRRARRRSGREVTITAAEGNVIHELAGRPGDRDDRAGDRRALDRRAGAGRRRPADRDRDRRRQARVRAGRLPGPRRARRRSGDRRGGGRRDRRRRVRWCGCTPATPAPPTRICAASCALRAPAIGGGPPAGALVFSCNGRGQSMFGACDHDATMLEDELGGAPVGRLLRRRRDRPGRAVAASCTASRPRWPCSPPDGGGRRDRLARRAWPGRIPLPVAVVLVTGATGGIGHAIARALARAGRRLILTGRRAEVLDGARRRARRAHVVACDLASREAVAGWAGEAVEAGVDVLVANAALPASGLLTELTQDQIDTMLEVNLRAPIALARALLPSMVERGRGHLVFVSSLQGKAAVAGLVAVLGDQVRAARLRARASARTCAPTASASRPSSRASSATPACSPTPASRCPRASAPARPQDVAAAVIRRSTRTAPSSTSRRSPLRLGSAVAGLAPALAAAVSRRLGSHEIATHDGRAPALVSLTAGRGSLTRRRSRRVDRLSAALVPGPRARRSPRTARR